MKKADIILVKTQNDLLSWMVSLFTRSKYCHAALVVDKETLIEANTKEVDTYSIDKYKKIDVFRVNGLTEDQVNAVVSSCMKEIGKWYDFKAVAYLAWLYITCQRDKINAWNDKNRWFCTEMLAYKFNEVGKRFNKLSLSNVSPADISVSKIVKQVSEEWEN